MKYPPHEFIPERTSTSYYSPEQSHEWGIVLAGGEGRRLQRFLKSQFGYEHPKQYCAILGRRSMLRHTIDRAERVIPRNKLMTVVNRHHLPYAADDLSDRPSHTIVIQPSNRETAPGILLPLLHIYHRDPEATVALFPSDHFIREEDRFMDHVRSAFAFSQQYHGFLIALGLEPDRLEAGYGWIEKGETLGFHHEKELRLVHRFWEKPSIEVMRGLYDRGCLWNTLTLVGKAFLFLNLFQLFAPEVYRPMLRIREALGTSHEQDVVEDAFTSIPAVNFSQSILERCPQHLGVIPVSGVYWSDWGDEHRILSDLSKFGYSIPAGVADIPSAVAVPS